MKTKEEQDSESAPEQYASDQLEDAANRAAPRLRIYGIRTRKRNPVPDSPVPNSSREAGKRLFISKASAQKAARTAEKTVSAAKNAVQAIRKSAQSMTAALIAGGSTVGFLLIMMFLSAALIGSAYGIFFSGDSAGNSELTLRSVVRDINTEFLSELNAAKTAESHDVLEVSGSRSVWKDVLAVYAVQVNMNTDDPIEVATMAEEKKALLSDIFWEMNSIDHHTETRKQTITLEFDDGRGHVISRPIELSRTYLYVEISHKTIEEMADRYRFDEKQRATLQDLLKEENNILWSAVLYGISSGDGNIVNVAASQLGNVGGEPYWSWYGFPYRVEWCAIFVSWCANECGYIDAEVIPKFALVDDGEYWFKQRDRWMDRYYEPMPGDIIFFDWVESDTGMPDGECNHVGIVEKVENGYIYTIEGNASDSCKELAYPLGYFEILGFGVPAY